MADWKEAQIRAGIDSLQPGNFDDVIAILDSVIAMAKRAPGAPIVQPFQRVMFFEADGDDTWTPPDEVSAFTIYVYGGGGPTSSNQQGHRTEVAYDGVTVIANGGAGTQVNAGGAGATAGTGGDINLEGRNGGASLAPSTPAPGPYQHPRIGEGVATSTSGDGAGGSGGLGIKRFIKSSGDVAISFNTGSVLGGAVNGAVIIEY